MSKTQMPVLSKTLLALLFTSELGAQPRVAFDVVSIHASTRTNEQPYIRDSSGGLVMMQDITVRELIQAAFEVLPGQVTGGPDWMGRDRYDISARAEDIVGSIPNGELWPRIRSLLGDRFDLRTRRETREMSFYELAINKGGHKLKQGVSGDQNLSVARGMIRTNRVPMDVLAGVLSQQLGRPVIDKTGLLGDYTFLLTWADANTGSPVELKVAAAAEGRSLFTALQEELGLRLEPQRGPVEIIVVEHVERPSAN